MNNLTSFISSLLLVITFSSCSSNDLQRFKAFGEQAFDAKAWVVADEVERGHMFFDFLKQNSPIVGKNVDFILKNLGPSTGYYLYDHFPAYYIGPKPTGSNAKAYLVAFVIDHDTNKVAEIYVHPDI